ncbi:hypothetical protein HG531_012910 [Fusarium graminearum]|nr:hypothetical protein HG531_012910 [Fusarium graminearum]
MFTYGIRHSTRYRTFPKSHLQLGTRLLPSLPLTVSQQAPQDLTTGALGNYVDELNTALQPLVSSLVLFDMLVNALRYLIVRLALGLGRLDDESLGDFASAEIGDLDNGAVVHKGMSEQMGFELCRSDLMSLFVCVSDWVQDAENWGAYLDLDELLDTINNDEMLRSLWWDKGHLLDLEALNGRKEQFEVELGKDDCLVAIVDTLLYVSYYVAQWQEAKLDLSIHASGFAAFFVLDRRLNDIRNDIAVSDLNRFLQFSQIRHLPLALALDPIQGLQLRRILALRDQIVDCLEWLLTLSPRNGEEKDAIFRDTGAFRCLKSDLEKGNTGK